MRQPLVAIRERIDGGSILSSVRSCVEDVGRGTVPCPTLSHNRQELLALFAVDGVAGSGQAPSGADPAGDGEAGEGARKKASLAEATALLARDNALTKREAEIFALLARGYRHGEIQERLSVSVSTVHTHVANIYAKLGIHSHKELCALVRRVRDDLVGGKGPS